MLPNGEPRSAAARRMLQEGVTYAIPHRGELPSLCNYYASTQSEPAQLQALEDQRCILSTVYGWLRDCGLASG